MKSQLTEPQLREIYAKQKIVSLFNLMLDVLGGRYSLMANWKDGAYREPELQGDVWCAELMLDGEPCAWVNLSGCTPAGMYREIARLLDKYNLTPPEGAEAHEG